MTDYNEIAKDLGARWEYDDVDTIWKSNGQALDTALVGIWKDEQGNWRVVDFEGIPSYEKHKSYEDAQEQANMIESDLIGD